jgi:hypothetical protein
MALPEAPLENPGKMRPSSRARIAGEGWDDAGMGVREKQNNLITHAFSMQSDYQSRTGLISRLHDHIFLSKIKISCLEDLHSLPSFFGL